MSFRPSRRAALLGLASLGASTPAIAEPLGEFLKLFEPAQRPRVLRKPAPRPRPMPSRRLTAPDFTAFHPDGWRLAGVRPYRQGGLRLEAERPVEVGGQSRIVVHNYGHGGAGISLAFSSAERAVALVERACERQQLNASTSHVAVLGAGIMGLTTALALHDRQPSRRVTIYASAVDPAATTSFKAGGKFAHVGEFVESDSTAYRAEMERHLARSAARIRTLSQSPNGGRYGIGMRACYSLSGAGGDDVRVALGKASHVAHTYSTWLIDPTRLLPALHQDLAARGIRLVERTLQTRTDVYALDETIVVNCTGMGARDLFGDRDLVGRRGHLVRLANPQQLDYLINSWCGDASIRYLFARSNDIVIGGTFEEPHGCDAFDATNRHDVAVCDRILQSARKLTEAGNKRCA